MSTLDLKLLKNNNIDILLIRVDGVTNNFTFYARNLL